LVGMLLGMKPRLMSKYRLERSVLKWRLARRRRNQDSWMSSIPNASSVAGSMRPTHSEQAKYVSRRTWRVARDGELPKRDTRYAGRGVLAGGKRAKAW